MSSVPSPIGPDNFESFIETSSPYVVARINGATYAASAFDIGLTAHGATSTGSVTLPITGNPDFSQAFANVGATAVTGEIFIGWPPSMPAIGRAPSIAGLTRAYYGLVGQYDPNFSGDHVTFSLRSLASPLVDQKIQTIATNITTTAFIAGVCQQFGLGFQSFLPNSPLTVQEVLGALYIGGSNFAASIAAMRIWDLIVQCAQFDNVDVWEDQGTVYYGAPSLVSRPTIDLKYGRDLSVDDGLLGTHALMFAKDVQVEVRSAQPRVSQSNAVRYVANGDGTTSLTAVSKTTIGSPQWGTPSIVTTTYGPSGTIISQRTISGGKFSSGFTSQGKEASAQRYLYVLQNASPAACNAYAVSQWRRISQQEYTIQLRMPLTKAKGLIPLTALLRVHNVPYAKFNDTYYPRTIRLAGGSDRAFTYDIDAVDHMLPQGAV